MPADALSVAADVAIGVGGAVVGGLGTWAAVSGKFGRLEAKVGAVEDTTRRLEKKIDDNEKEDRAERLRMHGENQASLTALNQRLDSVIIVDRRKPGERAT